MSLLKRYQKPKPDPEAVTLLNRFKSELGPASYVYIFGHLAKAYTLYYHNAGYISLNVSQIPPAALHEMLNQINNDVLDRTKPRPADLPGG